MYITQIPLKFVMPFLFLKFKIYVKIAFLETMLKLNMKTNING